MSQNNGQTAQVMVCLNNRANSDILNDWLTGEFQIISCDMDAGNLLRVDLILADLRNLRDMHIHLDEALESASSNLHTIPVILLMHNRRIPTLDRHLFKYIGDTVTIPTTKMKLKTSIMQVLSKRHQDMMQAVNIENELDTIISESGSNQTIEETTTRIIDYVSRTMPLDFQHIIIIRNGEAQLSAFAGYKGKTTGFDDWCVTVENIPEPYRHALFHNQPITDQSNIDWSDIVVPMLKGAKTFIVVPIRTDHTLLGFIALGNTIKISNLETYSSRLMTIAQEIAPAIENAIQHEDSMANAVIEERQRLARELHDSVTQTLFSASIIAEAIPRKWNDAPPDATLLMQELHQLTRGALAETRMLLLEMRPNAIQQISFDDLLRQLAEGIWSRKQIQITFNIESDTGLEVSDKLALYRIAQETLNNTIKHAHATQVSIGFQYADRLVLEISDDGGGFNTMLPADSGMGLHIMRERAEAIDAHLTIYSDDTGTRVIVER